MRLSDRRWQLAGITLVLTVGSALYRALYADGLEQSSAIFIGLPALLALILGAVGKPKTSMGVAMMATTLALLLSGIVLSEGVVWILVAAPIFYLMTFRFGAGGAAYRQRVRWGVPRVLPHVPIGAQLYYGAGCDVCEPVARWVSGRSPVGLELVPAQQHPDRDLERLTYRHADGSEEDGVAALARAFEHINLAWAVLGFAVRLPIVLPLLQLIVDVSGGGPRRIPRGPVEAACQAPKTAGKTFGKTSVRNHQAPTSRIAPGITNRSQ